jgi:hypothetical protein
MSCWAAQGACYSALVGFGEFVMEGLNLFGSMIKFDFDILQGFDVGLVPG